MDNIITKQEIQEMINTKPSSVARILKSKHTELYNLILNTFLDIPEMKFNEKLYLYINGDVRRRCPISGKFTPFLNYSKGYQNYYSVIEYGISKELKANSKEFRCCENNKCENTFKTYKKSKKQYCSVQCSNSHLGQQKLISMRKTKLERYGDENYTNHKKTQETKLKKYGYKHFPKYEDMQKIFKEKYDVEHPMQIPDAKRKSKETFNRKYGGFTFQSDELVEKVQITNIKKYGFKNHNQNQKYRENLSKLALGGKIGFKTEKFGDWLDDNNVINTSQIVSVRENNRNKMRDNFYNNVLSKSDNIIPLFTKTEYSGSKTLNNGVLNSNRYNFKCKKCENEFTSTYVNGRIPICRKCNPINISTTHKLILDFISSVYSGKVITNTRKIINPLELDIYLPNKKIAIEVNGCYWHSERSGEKDKKYHVTKTNQCDDKGIMLIHILDVEWDTKRDIVKSIIRNILGVNENKIYGRNCDIRIIDNKVASDFYNTNHIQGAVKSSVNVGLFNNDIMVSAMSFSKNRFGIDTEWELTRYANIINTTVLGGISKLFKWFKNNYNPNTIKTFADRRYFNGNSYMNIGFNLTSTTSPNYYYTKDYMLLESRQKYQKHKLKNILDTYSPEITEWENMQINGFDRYWDCGNKKFVYVNQNI